MNFEKLKQLYRDIYHANKNAGAGSENPYYYKGSAYRAGKEATRWVGIEYQSGFSRGVVYYWSEVVEIENWLSALARRYGLTKAFKANGII